MLRKHSDRRCGASMSTIVVAWIGVACGVWIGVGPPAVAVERAVPWKELPADVRTALDRAAARYEDVALRFTCREHLRNVRYVRGRARRQRIAEHDYLLVRRANSIAAQRTPYRARTGSAAAPRAAPEPYAWFHLFAPAVRSQLHYVLDEPIAAHGTIAWPIRWAASAPVTDRRSVQQWSGEALVEAGSGLLLEIIAQPNFQDSRLAQRYLRYKRSTPVRFGLFSGGSVTTGKLEGRGLVLFRTRAKPLGARIRVVFAVVSEDHLRLPSTAEWEQFHAVGLDPGDRETRRRVVATYSDYRFFRTETDAVVGR